jgi:hypothetical protein
MRGRPIKHSHYTFMAGSTTTGMWGPADGRDGSQSPLHDDR